ncbi:hypothetical protein ScPMuIL_006228 [Solemya velum]
MVTYTSRNGVAVCLLIKFAASLHRASHSHAGCLTGSQFSQNALGCHITSCLLPCLTNMEETSMGQQRIPEFSLQWK